MQKGARGKKKGRERSGKKEKGVKITKEGGKVEKRKGEKTGGEGGGGERRAKEGREEKKGEKKGRNNGEMRGKRGKLGEKGVLNGAKKTLEASSWTNVAQKFGKKTPCSFLTAILPKFWAKKIQSLAVRIPGFGGKNSFWQKNAFFGEKKPFPFECICRPHNGRAGEVTRA